MSLYWLHKSFGLFCDAAAQLRREHVVCSERVEVGDWDLGVRRDSLYYPALFDSLIGTGCET